MRRFKKVSFRTIRLDSGLNETTTLDFDRTWPNNNIVLPDGSMTFTNDSYDMNFITSIELDRQSHSSQFHLVPLYE